MESDSSEITNHKYKEFITFKIMTSSSNNIKPQNCWEYMKCPDERRKKCKVFKLDFGKECWFLVRDGVEGCYNSKKYNNCDDCPWYVKNNPK